MRNLKLLEIYQPPPPRYQKKRKSQSTRKRKNITSRKSFNHPKIASTIIKKASNPHLKILNFSKNPNSIGKVFNSFEVTRPNKPSPHEKISIPDNLTPLESFNLPMHMKIEINHPENIPPPEIFQIPEQTLHHRNDTPPEKIPNTSESISTPPKKFKPLPEKSQSA